MASFTADRRRPQFVALGQPSSFAKSSPFSVLPQPEKLVDSDEVGCGGTLSEIYTISCRFTDFENLPREPGDRTQSRRLKCHGYEWKIHVLPGGVEDSDDENVHVSVFLSLLSDVTNGVMAKCRVRAGSHSLSHERPRLFKNSNDEWGYCNFAKRDDVLDPKKGYLDSGGAFLVKVNIQICTEDNPSWTPKNKLQADMLQLLESAKFSDVTFIVGESKFSAHRSILLARSPTLASVVEENCGSDVEISGVDPSTFRAFLRFVYGDELPSTSEIKSSAFALLEAANRFGCTRMKLAVEAEVAKTVLSAENAAEWILFADSHSCPLLKEAAVAIFVSDTKAVRKSPGWTALKESAQILDELMEAKECGVQPNHVSDGNVKSMSVSSLCEQLEENGLDVDGTREMLVERLEKFIFGDGNIFKTE